MFMQDSTRFVAAGSVLPVSLVPTPARTGLIAGTLVETAAGWRAVETLHRGERVHTFDGGLREIVALDHAWLDAGTELLTLPGGVLNNCADLAILPGQHLLVDTWDEPALPDADMALVPADALAGLCGTVRRRLTDRVQRVTPLFADEEVVYANGGLLLHCPAITAGPGRLPQSDYFTRLAGSQARALMCRALPTDDTAPAAPLPRPDTRFLNAVSAGLRAVRRSRHAI